MKALVLVGGYGTRLRPLTLTCLKPLVPLANLPILEHVVEACQVAGVNEIVLAISYRPDAMMAALKEMETKYKMKITCSVETEPMGTAGPLALAREVLSSDGEPFFVFNSDITCEFPLKELLAFHTAHGKEGTVMVTRVEEPSKYGVVVHDDKGRIQHFVEKPQTFVGNHINAGIYCFQPSILERISMRPTSIEKEIFPDMAEQGQLFAMLLPGYWMDVGQPKDYLIGMCMHLASLRKKFPERLAAIPGAAGASAGGAGAVAVIAASAIIKGDVLIDPSATVAEGCLLGPNVVIGPGCVVEQGARLERCTLLSGTRVKAHACVKNTILGWNNTVGKWARIDGGAVFGEDVQIGDETIVNGGIILPHKSVKDNIFTPGTIVM